jgi:hypothetical protein
MIRYELLPHEYLCALFLSYEYDLWPYHPMILHKAVALNVLNARVMGGTSTIFRHDSP